MQYLHKQSKGAAEATPVKGERMSASTERPITQADLGQLELRITKQIHVSETKTTTQIHVSETKTTTQIHVSDTKTAKQFSVLEKKIDKLNASIQPIVNIYNKVLSQAVKLIIYGLATSAGFGLMWIIAQAIRLF